MRSGPLLGLCLSIRAHTRIFTYRLDPSVGLSFDASPALGIYLSMRSFSGLDLWIGSTSSWLSAIGRIPRPGLAYQADSAWGVRLSIGPTSGPSFPIRSHPRRCFHKSGQFLGLLLLIRPTPRLYFHQPVDQTRLRASRCRSNLISGRLSIRSIAGYSSIGANLRLRGSYISALALQLRCKSASWRRSLPRNSFSVQVTSLRPTFLCKSVRCWSPFLPVAIRWKSFGFPRSSAPPFAQFACQSSSSLAG